MSLREILSRVKKGEARLLFDYLRFFVFADGALVGNSATHSRTIGKARQVSQIILAACGTLELFFLAHRLTPLLDEYFLEMALFNPARDSTFARDCSRV